MLHAGSSTRQACVYILHAAPLECNSQSEPRQATTLLECATLDRQAHRARPELSPAMTVSRVGTGYLCILPMMYSLALRFVITCARPSLRIRIPSIYVCNGRAEKMDLQCGHNYMYTYMVCCLLLVIMKALKCITLSAIIHTVSV